MTATAAEVVHEDRDVDLATYVAAHRAALLRIAESITGDPHDAEDLLQVALLAAAPHWDRVTHRRAYLRRAMVTRWAGRHRRAAARAEWLTDRLPEPAVEDEPPPRHSPEMWALVTALPPRQRAAVVLRFYEGLSEKEAAAVLGCSVGGVKSTTSRGVAGLRRRLAADPGALATLADVAPYPLVS